MTPPVKLYQFSLCPFCSKVRAALELKGVPHELIEVSPRSKEELPPLPEGSPRKVPVLQFGSQLVEDSTRILEFIEANIAGSMSFRPTDDAAAERGVEIERWVDEVFIRALPTVIYGSWREAIQAAGIIGRSTKLAGAQRVGVKVAGPVVMHLVAKRILKKSGHTDPHAWVRGSVEQFSEWLGDSNFVTGNDLSLGDVAMHGAISCVREFPIFGEIMKQPRLAGWYRRIEGMREAGASLAA